jgi:hypothetical protein
LYLFVNFDYMSGKLRFRSMGRRPRRCRANSGRVPGRYQVLAHQASVPDLHADTGHPDLDAGSVFVPLLPMLDPIPIPIPVPLLDASLPADARRAFLLAHALGLGRRGQQGGGADDRGGDREAIERQSHVLILSGGFHWMTGSTTFHSAFGSKESQASVGIATQW